MTLEMCKPNKLTSSSDPLTGWQQMTLTRQTAKASRHHRWIAQAALAASFLAGVWIVAHDSSTDPAPREGTSTAPKAVELSLISDFHYKHVQLNLEDSWHSPRGKVYRRQVRGAARVVRSFVIAPRIAKYHDLQVAILQPPLLEANHSGTTQLLPPHLQSAPELPQLHLLRNRFSRVFAAVTFPFRFIASR